MRPTCSAPGSDIKKARNEVCFLRLQGVRSDAEAAVPEWIGRRRRLARCGSRVLPCAPSKPACSASRGRAGREVPRRGHLGGGRVQALPGGHGERRPGGQAGVRLHRRVRVQRGGLPIAPWNEQAASFSRVSLVFQTLNEWGEAYSLCAFQQGGGVDFLACMDGPHAPGLGDRAGWRTELGRAASVPWLLPVVRDQL